MLYASLLSAQDIHWTQFYAAPMNISPGLIGIFPGETRFMANYRSQWHSVPVDYSTLGLSVDSSCRIRTPTATSSPWGLASTTTRAACPASISPI